MGIQGLRSTGNFVTDQRPKNWREGVLLLAPNGTAPLYALTAAMKSKRTDDPEFYWWDKLMQTRRVELSANISANATTIPVTSGAKGFKTNDVMLVEHTREQMRVASDSSSDTSLTVERGWAGSTKTAVTYNGANVNPNLANIGSAFEQGSLDPQAIAFDPVKRENFTQIGRDTFAHTRTARRTRLRTGDDVKEAKRECLEIHSMGIERQFWFGKKSSGTQNGEPIYTTDGLEQFIDSGNIRTAGATTDLAQFEEWMKDMFLYGSSEKMAFTGNKGMLVIQQICRKNADYQLMQGQKEFGMNVSRLVSPFGELVLKTHPQFNQMTSGNNAATSPYLAVDSWFWVLDMANFVYRFVDDTTYQPKLQANGLDGTKSGYLTECGLEVHHPLSHFLIKGLNAAAADT